MSDLQIIKDDYSALRKSNPRTAGRGAIIKAGESLKAKISAYNNEHLTRVRLVSVGCSGCTFDLLGLPND